MPKVTFVKDYRAKGSDPAIPAYKAGESYDLELSYADKYKRLGLATDYVAPAPKADTIAHAVQAGETVTVTPSYAPRSGRRTS